MFTPLKRQKEQGEGQEHQTAARAAGRGSSGSIAGALLQLQRNVGNQAMGQLLGAKAEDRECSCGGTCAECQGKHEHAQHNPPPGILGEMRRQVELPDWTHGKQTGTHTAMNSPLHTEDQEQEISGLKVNKSFCSCAAEIPKKIEWAEFMAKIYTDCGKDPSNKTGHDIVNCKNAELAKRGIVTTVGGTTSSTGAVTVKPVAGTCGPIWEKSTAIHEGAHHAHQQALEAAFGKGTSAFDAHWNNAPDWAADEANAYKTQIPFYQAVLLYLNSICGGHQGFSGWWALGGGLAGLGLGALIGSIFGPVGTFVGMGIGALVGAIASGLWGGRKK
jgi:hypothetical protein